MNAPTPPSATVYQLDDLLDRARLDEGHHIPAKLAVIGRPVAHSASPQLQQPALDRAGIAARYVRVEVPPGKVAECFTRMRAIGFIGCNITVPHKFEAMEACGEVHPDARALGAVNTVRFDAETIRGFNTDGPGFVRAIHEDFDRPLSTMSVLVLGAGGGAGQAIAAQCAMQGVERLVLVNRTVAKIAELSNRLRVLGPTCEITALGFDDPRLAAEAAACDLVVNTSSVGLKAGDPSILNPAHLLPKHLVYDTIYQPPVTPLLAAAAERGCRRANGRSLLVHQGVLAFQHWFPDTDPLAIMREALPV